MVMGVTAAAAAAAVAAHERIGPLHPTPSCLPPAPAAQAIGPSAQLRVVEGALHALDGKEEEGAAAIADFVAALAP